MSDRIRLTEIASESWEHPADRAALDALRAIPAFDELVRRIVGLLGERGVRLLFQANAVRVSPTQHGRVHAIYDRVLHTLDSPSRPELFVTQASTVNAGAYGLDQPFIVVHSATLSLLDDEELEFVLAHELGHVMSQHALYHTLLRLMLWVGSAASFVPWGLVSRPVELALLEWYRKSELSCDRAGLLAVQSPTVAIRTMVKMAGGEGDQPADIEAFLEQGRAYQQAGNVIDRVFKILNAIGNTHPLFAPRAAELHSWAGSGAYENVIGGIYLRRNDPLRPTRAALDVAGDVAASYAESVSTLKTEVVTGARNAAVAARDAARSFSNAVSGRKKP